MPKNDSFKLISIVVPAYKQGKTIVKDIKNLNEVLSTLNTPYEIIVVVDGFVDDTYDKVKSVKLKNLTLLGYEKNHGKGYAVKYGVERANGDLTGLS